MALKKKAEWVAALRSGQYKQITGTLEELNPDGTVKGNCCIGVYCHVLGLKGDPDEAHSDHKDVGNTEYFTRFEGGQVGELDCPEEYGLSSYDQNRLMHYNDHECWDFAKIADWIERNLE